MAPRSLKNKKKTKHSRTRRERQRRRHMRGGGFLDLFRPTKKDAAYCEAQYAKCNASIKPDSESVNDDSSSSVDDDSSFFKTPTFITNFFGEKKDSTASNEEVEGEDEGIEMQEIPGTEQPGITPAPPLEPGITPAPPLEPGIAPALPLETVVDNNDYYTDVGKEQDAQYNKSLQTRQMPLLPPAQLIPPYRPMVSSAAAGGS